VQCGFADGGVGLVDQWMDLGHGAVIGFEMLFDERLWKPEPNRNAPEL
jgi:hypothetical protein